MSRFTTPLLVWCPWSSTCMRTSVALLPLPVLARTDSHSPYTVCSTLLCWTVAWLVYLSSFLISLCAFLGLVLAFSYALFLACCRVLKMSIAPTIVTFHFFSGTFPDFMSWSGTRWARDRPLNRLLFDSFFQLCYPVPFLPDPICIYLLDLSFPGSRDNPYFTVLAFDRSSAMIIPDSLWDLC